MRRNRILLVTTALASLTWGGSAWAQDCSTSTPGAPSSETTLTCATDTVTTATTNTNGNNPATRSRTQTFANAFVGRVNSGITVSGFGLEVIGSGSAPITFENNGSIINNSGSAGLSDGLRLIGHGGLITYTGNGTLRTDSGAALYIDSRGGSGVNIGSAAAPITANYFGPTAVYIGNNDSSRTTDVNAFFSGGALNSQSGIVIQRVINSTINVTTTGNTVIAPTNGFSGISIDLFPSDVPSNSITANVSVVTDARIGTAASPVGDVGIIVFGNSNSANASVSLTGTGSIFARRGIQVNPGGIARVTTAPGTTITLSTSNDLAIGAGIRSQGPDVGIEAAGRILGAQDGISVSGLLRPGTDTQPIVGGSGPVSVALLGTGSISAFRLGITAENFGSGPTRISTAAGTSIHVAQGQGQTPSAGIRSVAFGSGDIILDVGGAIDIQAIAGSDNHGVLASAVNGTIDVTIRAGSVVNATATGTSSATALTVRRNSNGSGVSNTLVLGTLRGPIAANFLGTLQVGNGGTTGVLEGNVVNNGTLIFNRSDASTYAGIISGGGALRQAGSGTTILTGTSTFTGGTTVAAGTLLVNGSVPGGVQVNDGGTLGGTGAVGATNVASGGRLAPGAGGVGTLAVNGNLVLQSGSLTLIDLTPAGADRINATGTATINGGLTALSSGGTLSAGRYTILNAAGGVTGNFAPFTTEGPFPSSPRLEYDANNVVLVLQGDTSFNVLQRDTLIIGQATVTTQQVNLFSTRLLGRLNGGTPLFDRSFSVAFADPVVQSALVQARLAITNAGAPALIVFSDPVLVSRSVTSATISASRFTLTGQRDTTITEQTTGGAAVTSVRGDTRSCGAAVAALPSSQRPTCAPPPAGETYSIPAGTVDQRTIVTTEYSVADARTDTVTTTTNETYELNGTAVPVGTVHAAVQSGLYDLGSRFLARAGRDGVPSLFGARPAGGSGTVWAETYGFRVRQDARGGLPGERRDAWGVAGGFSMLAAPGIQVGAGVDHGRLDLDVAATGETADVELTQVGMTGRFDSGPFSVSAAVAYGFGEVDSERNFMGTAAGGYDVETIGAFAEARYDIRAGGWRIAPVAGLDWLQVESDAFSESGSFGFVVPATEHERTRAFAGLEVGRELPLGRLARLEVTASARYLALLNGQERVLPVAFAAAPGTPLVMRGLDEEDSVLLGAQARVGLSHGLDVYLAYDGRFAGAYDAHAATLGLRLSW